MKKLLMLACFSLVLTACDTGSHNNTSKTVKTDNTERNVRDRSGETLTPADQSESEGDLTITQKIRQALVGDDALSTNAKNIKVITINGVVTLRGVVNSEQERNAIINKVQNVHGINKVNNLLEVKS
jgi:osmotically-inducible protein OsmY